MLLLTLIVLASELKMSLGCWGGGGNNADPRNATTGNTTKNQFSSEDEDTDYIIPGDDHGFSAKFKGDLSDPKVWVLHWDPPDAYTAKNYIEWYKNYEALMKEREAQNEASLAWAMDPDNPKNAEAKAEYNAKAGLAPAPSWWSVDGFGNAGNDAPPWAKEYTDQPALCFLDPKLGSCTNYHVRWGWNRLKLDCEEFVFSGCHGNDNNFMTKKSCIEACNKNERDHPCYGGQKDNDFQEVFHMTADDVPYLMDWDPPTF